MEKAKFALAMMNPSVQLKLGKLTGWVDSLLDAMNQTDVDVSIQKVESQDDFQALMLELLKKAKIARIEDKNALVIELGKRRKLRLILSFKVVGE